MHSYHLASELVSNRRNPKPRGARTIRLEVARRAREDRRRQP